MSAERLRLVIFDVDGTLVDSQDDIIASMRGAFTRAGLAHPEDGAVRSIVGLSLDVAIPQLAPEADAHTHASMVAWYKDTYMELRRSRGAELSSPLYPGVAAGLAALRRRPEMLLGVATGKSARGLDRLLEGHGMQSWFVTRQVADHHPSKPHPSMLHAALSETGVPAQDAVMVGDTTYDRDMAAAAGVAFVGVDWGYHGRDALAGAQAILGHFDELPAALETIWRHGE